MYLADLHSLGNYLEAGLWILLGLGFAVHATRSPRPQWRRGWVTSLALVAFGLSDLAEVGTGAWWRPWWLLTWKGGCVAIFGVLLAQHYRGKRQQAKIAAGERTELKESMQ